MSFVFKSGAPHEATVFGDPSTTATVTACLYYDAALVAQLQVPPSAVRWKSVAKGRGWKYGDPTVVEDGVLKMSLAAGAVGAPLDAKVQLKGKGFALPDPAVPVPGTVSSVTMQVGNDTSTTCLGATFTSPFSTNKANASGTTAVFKAKLKL
jgi:hypothetical protein